MRRFFALCCLASILLGSVAQAKSLLAYSKIGNAIEASGPGATTQQQRNVRILLNIIRTTGGSVDAINSSLDMTEPFRAGRRPLTGATNSGPDTLQYDATIFLGGRVVTVSAGQVRPDSLTLLSIQGASARVKPAVPMLFMRDNVPAVSGVTGAEWATTTSCSLGVTGVANQANGLAFHFAGDHNVSLTHAYVESATGIYETGDLRRILYGTVPASEYRVSLTDKSTGRALPCKQCDSLQSYAAVDTLLMWDRQYNTLLGQASTITFVNPFGAGSAADSSANANGTPNPATEGDFTLMLCGLAHLDSLSGHKVFGDKVIRIAPVIYGGLSRQQRGSSWRTPGSPQGIDPSDTAAFYATLDSIKSYPGMKVTFAINVDSASTYARDLIKMKQIGQAKFTPQVWNGCYLPSSGTDTSSAGKLNQFYQPTDVFGRFRKRAAVGDSVMHTVLGADTSICALLTRARQMCDSLTGRTSRIAVAPDDDWSPLQITGADAGGTGIDSVLYAIKLAGFAGVVSNGQDPDCGASKVSSGPSKTNPRGYYQTQTKYTSAKIPQLVGFKLLTHSGYGLEGDIRQMAGTKSAGGGIDSSTTALPVGLIYQDLARLWSGALLDVDNSYDTWAYDDPGGSGIRGWDDIAMRKVDRTQAAVGRPVVRGNVFRLSCSDLSGDPNFPSRRLWHVLKSAYNACQIINKLAGRTVVVFSYPEDIDP